jgi:hypothetical protein
MPYSTSLITRCGVKFRPVIEKTRPPLRGRMLSLPTVSPALTSDAHSNWNWKAIEDEFSEMLTRPSTLGTIL